MIVSALHTTAILRGVEVSDPEKMRLFAENVIIGLTERVNRDERIRAVENLELRSRVQAAESKSVALELRVAELQEQIKKQKQKQEETGQ